MLPYIVRLAQHIISLRCSLSHSSAGNIPFPAPRIRPLCNSNAVWCYYSLSTQESENSLAVHRFNWRRTRLPMEMEEQQTKSISTPCLIHLNLANIKTTLFILSGACVSRSQPENETNLYHIINNKDFFFCFVCAGRCLALLLHFPFGVRLPDSVSTLAILGPARPGRLSVCVYRPFERKKPRRLQWPPSPIILYFTHEYIYIYTRISAAAATKSRIIFFVFWFASFSHLAPRSHKRIRTLTIFYIRICICIRFAA